MNIVAGVVLGLAMGLGVSAAPLAAAEGQTAPGKPVVAMGEYYPYAVFEEGKLPRGLFVSILEQVSKDSAIAFEYRTSSYARARRNFGQGEADLTAVFMGTELQEDWQPLGSIGHLSVLLLPRKGVVINGPADMANKSVAYLENGVFARKFLDALAQKVPLQRIAVASNVPQMKMLERGRADVAVVTDAMYLAMLAGVPPAPESPDWASRIGDPVEITCVDVQLAMNRNSAYQQDAGRIREALRKLREDGRINKIFADYGMMGGPDCPKHFKKWNSPK